MIKEIHQSFYTEVDKLLTEAKISKSLDTTKGELIAKAERLKALGFTNTKEVLEAERELERLENNKWQNNQKENLIKAINYFSFKYPTYKFITEESVKKICQKYNLVYSTIDRYIGTVPEKNLKHIEDFKIFEEDECFYIKLANNYGRVLNFQFIDNLEFNEIQKLKKENYDDYRRKYRREYTITIDNDLDIEKCPLEIAAPIKDFNTAGMEVKDYKLSSKIEIPDPIVLKPVLFNKQKFYLIVTAWGDEASDELIVNSRNN